MNEANKAALDDIAAEEAMEAEHFEDKHAAIRQKLDNADHEATRLMDQASVYNQKVALATSYAERGAWSRCEGVLCELEKDA